MPALREVIARRLAGYRRIAAWGAGTGGERALDHWLPRSQVLVVIDSRAETDSGRHLRGIPVAPPAALAGVGADCVVICADAQTEIRRQLADLPFDGDVFHVHELLPAHAEDSSQWTLLKIDVAAQKEGSWLDLVLDRPQIMLNLTFRAAKALDGPGWRRPLHILARLAHTITCVAFGVELPPSVAAGGGLVFAHIGPVVFNRNVVLGRFCTLYQGTTLGADDTGAAPVLGDFVIVYAGASLIGDCRVGDRCRVGAHALVLGRDCPADTVMVGQPAAPAGAGPHA